MNQVKKADPNNRTVAENRKARFSYEVLDTVEAGLVLTGTEVKSLRLGRVSINEAFAAEKDGEIWLYNAYFPEYESANRFNHEPRRARKLLLKSREIKKLHGQTERQGMTLIPLSIYFNDRGIAKMQLGLAHGKRKVDKRASEKEKDWTRDQHKLLKTRSRGD
jgi:SsrA-binding protein